MKQQGTGTGTGTATGTATGIPLEQSLLLPEFIREFWHILEPAIPYQHNWHLDVVTDHLVAVSAGDIKKLIINIPPGSAKSLICCVFWCAWHWAEIDPSWRWLFASYEAKLSTRDSVKCRRLIQSPEYQERYGDRFQFMGDANLKTYYENTAMGSRLSTSVSGSGTGNRANCILCLPGWVEVDTESGRIKIQEIVEGQLNLKVWTYDHRTEAAHLSRILRYEKNPPRPLVEIDLGDRVLECTEDHPVWVKGKGYVPAGEIQEGDRVLVL